MLEIIAQFLASEPIIYLFGLVCMIVLVKILRQFLP